MRGLLLEVDEEVVHGISDPVHISSHIALEPLRKGLVSPCMGKYGLLLDNESDKLKAEGFLVYAKFDVVLQGESLFNVEHLLLGFDLLSVGD